MPVIVDEEFGTITIRRSARATQVRIRVAPDGTLRASMPPYAPLFLLKRLIQRSRPALRTMLEHAAPEGVFTDGQQIGKSHALLVRRGEVLSVVRRKQHIIVTLPVDMELTDPRAVRKIRDMSAKALRIEAKSYLPRRLAYIADELGCQYSAVKFTHASSRWGSCSSAGVISLNIALMKLPFELIDYVLVHELSHTIHMNHSSAFWEQVAKGDPQYVQHKKALKQETPTI